MSDGIEHLDWEIDEGWVPISGDWGTVTHFQIVPGSLSISTEEQRGSAAWMLLVMVAIAIPFWLLAGYGLYCLVRR
jgi:uncharacterized protein with PQ loop repeat